MWSIGHRSAALDPMRSADAARPAAPVSPAVVLRWAAARDAVLRGLVHTLSNRIGTVVAAGGILAAGSAEVAGRVLEGEAERLELLLAEFRLLAADPFGDEAAPEPVVLHEVVAQAVALRAHLGGAPDAGAACEGVSEAPPVLASRAALLQALVVLLAGVEGDAVTLRAHVDERGVEVRADPAVAPDAVAAAAWLLGAAAGQGVLLPRFEVMQHAGA